MLDVFDVPSLDPKTKCELFGHKGEHYSVILENGKYIGFGSICTICKEHLNVTRSKW